MENWCGAPPVGRGPRASSSNEGGRASSSAVGVGRVWAACTTVITNHKVRRGLRLGIEGGKALGDWARIVCRASRGGSPVACGVRVSY